MDEEPLFRFFKYEHLPAFLQAASKPFHTLAEHIILNVPRCAERTAGLRKLLEAKDCVVRACIPGD